MSRSLKKGPFVDPKLAKKVAALGKEESVRRVKAAIDLASS